MFYDPPPQFVIPDDGREDRQAAASVEVQPSGRSLFDFKSKIAAAERRKRLIRR
jgi:hypothetical protein